MSCDAARCIVKPLTILQVAVYLTRLGGGVFGNSDVWIDEGDPWAALRALIAAAPLAFFALHPAI